MYYCRWIQLKSFRKTQQSRTFTCVVACPHVDKLIFVQLINHSYFSKFCLLLFFGGSFRVTLVVDWWFLPKILGLWWGPTKAIYRSVNTDRAIILFAGGGDTWTLFWVIKLVWTFCTERRRGAKNWNLWSAKLLRQIHYTVFFILRLLPRGKSIWGGDFSCRHGTPDHYLS